MDLRVVIFKISRPGESLVLRATPAIGFLLGRVKGVGFVFIADNLNILERNALFSFMLGLLRCHEFGFGTLLSSEILATTCITRSIGRLVYRSLSNFGIAWGHECFYSISASEYDMVIGIYICKLWFRLANGHLSRMASPNIDEIKKESLVEAHCTPYTVHPGATKMYRYVSKTF
ncbi:hypothetical protein FNV43_RR27215 [Rhamnella rubrinervis]|uniref:Uncharacterized protein n=1 Tax=Rhamnella rubrinervis TaxID=2594499 RepID=A0A8K0GSB7_9ROSA|nr:hypothetical protein FNV43_RR27215 [Rhamnella rubrinervis]